MYPLIFDRFGADTVKSRAGLEQQADILINSSTNLLTHQPTYKIHCVLVDECQFLDPKHIDQLREITYSWNVPVICYGLRTDFRTHLFPASQRYWTGCSLLLPSYSLDYSNLLIPLKKLKQHVTFVIQKLFII